jgi:hypothetical protein
LRAAFFRQPQSNSRAALLIRFVSGKHQAPTALDLLKQIVHPQFLEMSNARSIYFIAARIRGEPNNRDAARHGAVLLRRARYKSAGRKNFPKTRG